MHPMQRWRRIARILYRIVLPTAIIVAVGWQFASILRQPQLQNVTFPCRVEWLVPAGLLYLLNHTIWASFWVTLLRHQGYHSSYAVGLRAYFVSQYGKYIPGKVWVIVIRVAMLGGTIKDRAIVGVTATYEAVTAMAAGAILGAILLPMLNMDQLGFKAQNYVLIAIAAIPIGVGLLHRLIVRIVRNRLGPEAHFPDMNLLVLIRGLLQASVGWLLLGLSVWMIMQAFRPESVDLTWEAWIRLTAINCLSYVLGFIVLVAPAGGGVREWVLKVLLAKEIVGLNPEVAEAFAVIVALTIRLVWTLSEVLLAVLLYRFVAVGNDAPPVIKELAQ
jgi:hypothetical protein